MVRGEVGFAGLRLKCRLRDERPNGNAFTAQFPASFTRIPFPSRGVMVAMN
jgi:hypothetical protein